MKRSLKFSLVFFSSLSVLSDSLLFSNLSSVSVADEVLFSSPVLEVEELLESELFDLSVVLLEEDVELLPVELEDEEPVPAEELEVLDGVAAGVDDLAAELEDEEVEGAGLAGFGAGVGLGALLPPPPPTLLTLMRLHRPSSVRCLGRERAAIR